MRWSWRIGTVAGIGVYVHVTFLVLLLWVGLSGFFGHQNGGEAWSGVAFILALFGIVVLHELGHALTARRFGIRTRDITLLPIGGVARLERMPEEPRQELLVALAGPAVNVCLAILFFAVLAGGQQLSAMLGGRLPGGGFLASLMWANVILAGFNLVPAFPMDGGRVLRALLAYRLNYVKATNIAAGIGQAIAVVFGVVGVFSLLLGGAGPWANPFLVFIALFVWLGAAQEAGLVQMKSALGGVAVSQVMIVDFRTLSPEAPLSQAVEHLLGGWQHDFPVVQEGRLVGLLTRAALVEALAQRGPETVVGSVMARQFATAQPTEGVETALVRAREGDCQSLPVTRDGQLLGVLTTENIGEYLMVRAALHGELEGRKWGLQVMERPAG